MVYHTEPFIWLFASNSNLAENKLASLEATLVRNSAHSLTDSLTGVRCRATSVAKNINWDIIKFFFVESVGWKQQKRMHRIEGSDGYLSRDYSAAKIAIAYQYFYTIDIFDLQG